VKIQKQWAVLILVTAMSNSLASGQATETNLTFTVNQAIPDANPNGIALATNLTLPTLAGSITNVTVTLNLSGGFNGDLYAYLAGPNGGFAVLMNRSGTSNSASLFGYNDSGLSVTFSDSATNGDFHFYQDVNGYSLNGTTWQPDGRNIDPQSDPNLFGLTGPSTFLNSFNNTDPNGTWVLFLADLSDGAQSTIVSWSLDITTVPEPGTWAITGFGAAWLTLLRRRKRS